MRRPKGERASPNLIRTAAGDDLRDATEPIAYDERLPPCALRRFTKRLSW